MLSRLSIVSHSSRQMALAAHACRQIGGGTGRMKAPKMSLKERFPPEVLPLVACIAGGLVLVTSVSIKYLAFSPDMQIKSIYRQNGLRDTPEQVKEAKRWVTHKKGFSKFGNEGGFKPLFPK